MCLLLSILSSLSESDEDKLEEEMDAYCLLEWQKELVRRGECDPWNFEEDENLDDDK